MRYNNYHRHDHYSNIRTPDVIVKPQDYINRILELGHTHYFTTNHGCSGNVFEAYELCQKNNLKCVYGMEMYYVDDRLKQDKANYHIIVIGLTQNAYHHINRISSEANKTGFYYKPRIDMELLLSLPKDEVIITTACVGGRLFKTDDYEEKFVVPLKNHFNNNFMLEVQAHEDEYQAKWNKKILELSKKYDIEIIHANDTHYIYPEDAKYRDLFLKGKGIIYEEESNFILDYPDTETIIERYKDQGVLSEEEILRAINNTLVFDKAEDLGFDKEIKMPSIYPDYSIEEKHDKLKKILTKKWNQISKTIDKDKKQDYIKGIREEFKIIEETSEVKTVDYFLLNEKIIDKAVNEYGGKLSKTGRGSAVSFYINRLLGFTEVDRIDSDIPLYPTRFMSKSRILETKSLPDIDFNLIDQEPFIKASKDILGEDNVYFMVAYGTMQESAAFRNLCRAYDIDINEYNDVAKNLEQYQDNPKWKDIIEESKRYINVIDSISPSPCSFLLLDKSITKEIGLIKINDEICCCIDKDTAEDWKYLKNDYLVVKVWDIIYKTFDFAGIKPLSINELAQLLDDEVWKLYRDGMTATLNQTETDNATPKVMKYSPSSIAELSAFVAAIRPGFASLLDKFLNRQEHTTNVVEVDELLEDSFRYMLYQESIMKFLIWCGVEEDVTYGIIKKISKKKFKEKELEELKEKLLLGFISKTGSNEYFDDLWRVIEDASHYSFNSAHALSYAWDSAYGAYLKSKYPLEYYTVILNEFESNTKKIEKITRELSYFNINLKPIQFRYSKGEYFFDKNTNAIYEGVGSIKTLNSSVGEELYRLRYNEYDTFTDLLVNIKENTNVNSKVKPLILLNYFKEFGGSAKLLQVFELFDNRYKKTHKDKTKLERIAEIKEFESTLEDKSITLPEQIKVELEYLGYIQTTMPKVKEDYAVVTDINKKYKNPVISLYRLCDGSTEIIKVKKKNYDDNKFDVLDVIKTEERSQEYKWRKTENGFKMTSELEWILKRWKKVKFN